MKVKSASALLLVVAASTLTLAGCGGDGTDLTSAVPSITTQPTSAVVKVNDTVTFSVVAAGDTLTYQWFLDGVAISGATNPTYTVVSAGVNDTGTYTVVVTGLLSQVTSNPITLTLGAATSPTISSQPVGQLISVGSPLTLSVVAGGTSDTYQWYKSSVPLGGATGPTFSIATTAKTDSGNYYVVITNSVGSVTSTVVTVSVN